MTGTATWYMELCQSLDALRQNGDLCDVILEGNDGRGIPCHSVVLAAVSPYFKDTLVWSDEGCCKIKIGSVSSQVWDCIVNFVYTGKVITSANTEVATVVKKLKIPTLLKALQEQNNVDSDYASTRTSQRSISSTPGTVASDLSQPLNFSFPSPAVQIEPTSNNVGVSDNAVVQQASHAVESIPPPPQFPNLPQQILHAVVKTEPGLSEMEFANNLTEYHISNQATMFEAREEPPPTSIHAAPAAKEMPPLEPLLGLGLKIQNVTSIMQSGCGPSVPQFPLGEIPYPPRNRKKQTSRKSTSPKKLNVPESPSSSVDDHPKKSRGRPKGSKNKKKGLVDQSPPGIPSFKMNSHGPHGIQVIGKGTFDHPLGAAVPDDKSFIMGRGRGKGMRGRGRGGRGRGRGRGMKRLGVSTNLFRNAGKRGPVGRRNARKYAAENDLEDIPMDSDEVSPESYGKKKRFKCKYCTSTFETMALLYNHKATGHIVGGYSCKVCQQVFTAPAYLMKHKKSAHGIDSIKKRKYKYVPIKSRRQNACVAEGAAPTGDDYGIDGTLIPKTEVVEHLHACDQCQETFVTISRLKLHKKFNHRKSEKEKVKKILPGATVKPILGRYRNKYYHCKICFRVFRSPAQLRWHKVREHDSAEMLTSEKPLLPEESPDKEQMSKQVSQKPNETMSSADKEKVDIPVKTHQKEMDTSSTIENKINTDRLVGTKELSVTLVPIDNITRKMTDHKVDREQNLSSEDDDKTVDLNMDIDGYEEGQVVDFTGNEKTLEAEPTMLENATEGVPPKKSKREEEFPYTGTSITPIDSTCLICKKVFNTPVQLHWHKVKSHREESSVSNDSLALARQSRQYMCKVCFRVLSSPGALRWHRVRKHGFHDGRKPKPVTVLSKRGAPSEARKATSGTSVSPLADGVGSDSVLPPSLANRPRFVCEVCTKTFMFEYNYKRHCKMHGSKKHGLQARFKCPECDARFTRKDNMKFHFRKKHADKPLTVIGTISEITNSKVNTISPSKATSPKATPFKCQLCQRGFTKNSSLLQHIKVMHDGIKDHECPQCAKKFAHRFTMERHCQSYCRNKTPGAKEPEQPPNDPIPNEAV